MDATSACVNVYIIKMGIPFEPHLSVVRIIFCKFRYIVASGDHFPVFVIKLRIFSGAISVICSAVELKFSRKTLGCCMDALQMIPKC